MCSFRHNSAARARGAQLLPSFPSHQEGDQGFKLDIPPQLQLSLIEYLGLIKSSKHLSKLAPTGLGSQTVQSVRVLEEVASLLQKADQSLQKLAPMTWWSQCPSYRFLSLQLPLCECPHRRWRAGIHLHHFLRADCCFSCQLCI